MARLFVNIYIGYEKQNSSRRWFLSQPPGRYKWRPAEKPLVRSELVCFKETDIALVSVTKTQREEQTRDYRLFKIRRVTKQTDVEGFVWCLIRPSYINCESAMLNCSYNWWLSNKSIRQSKPVLLSTNERASTYEVHVTEYSVWYQLRMLTVRNMISCSATFSGLNRRQKGLWRKTAPLNFMIINMHYLMISPCRRNLWKKFFVERNSQKFLKKSCIC